ncbi:MAG: leucine-rich repeat domain-containing protein [Bacteroidales bacterium]|nr:leucine-rich repeat domain-containing protein [Bacteroidales bacterium]
MRLYIKIAILFLTLMLLFSCGTQHSASSSFSPEIENGTLMITNVNIRKIDKKLLTSDSLRNVIIEQCGLRRIKFPRGNKIESIKLFDNNFKRIPRSIKNCKNLEHLDLEHNRIKHIPRFIAQLDSLRSLDLNHNRLKLTESDVRHASKVKKLSIGGNNIEKLPENIGILQCTNLNLGKNKLSSLPASFADLKQVHHLIFYENEFVTIPEEIAGFENLQHLDFYKNHIKEIPDFVGNFDNLQYLYLSYNEIDAIPDTLRNLKNLTYFYIHHNKILTIPDWIVEMDSLERLGVGYNKLISMPDMSDMQSLIELNCEGNLLEEFPWKLVFKPGMQFLIVRDNLFELSDEEVEFLQQPHGVVISL